MVLGKGRGETSILFLIKYRCILYILQYINEMCLYY